MTKLGDKLIASAKRPEQRKPEKGVKRADKAQANSVKTESKPKSGSKKKQASARINQSTLHPQRIWPD